MAESSTCAPWCRAAFYVLLALVLAVFAITGAHPSRHTSPFPDSDPPSAAASALPSRHLAAASAIAKATRALRRSGFVFTATLLQLFPDRLLPFPAATVFAIPDAALDDFFSLPPWLLLDLLRYHAAPSKLSFHNLSTLPSGSTCIPTLLPGKNVAVRRRRGGMSVEINGVLITQPDIFLGDGYAVHGLQRPLFSPGARDEVISPPAARGCGSPKQIHDSNASLPWNSIVRALSSRGYISFSIGVRSVLDGLERDLGNLSGVTVFAPAEGGGFPDAASPAAVLERSVRLHLLPQRLTFVQLSRLRSNVILPTLAQGQGLQVMGTSNGGSNKSFSPSEKVEIVEPEAFSTEKVVIHGVARAFEAMAAS